MTRAITIYAAKRGYSVHEGERYTGELCWDEMLGHIAAMTVPIDRCGVSGLYGMRTPEEWQAQRETRRRNWVTVPDKKLGPMTIEALTVFANEHGSRGGDADELLPWSKQPDERVRLALMLLDACRPAGVNVVDAEVR
jgi:hypothetical protein